MYNFIIHVRVYINAAVKASAVFAIYHSSLNRGSNLTLTHTVLYNYLYSVSIRPHPLMIHWKIAQWATSNYY